LEKGLSGPHYRKYSKWIKKEKTMEAEKGHVLQPGTVKVVTDNFVARNPDYETYDLKANCQDFVLSYAAELGDAAFLEALLEFFQDSAKMECVIKKLGSGTKLKAVSAAITAYNLLAPSKALDKVAELAKGDQSLAFKPLVDSDQLVTINKPDVSE